jgi:GDP-L-fucose synthase
MVKRTLEEVPRPASPSATFALTGKRVWVAGHTGMVGSALIRRLQREACELLTVTRQQLDLRCQAETRSWMRASRPDVVLIAAATVGGIQANRTRPAEFIYDNLAIALNILHSAYEIGVEKLVFLGSSCIYPKFCAQPMTEDQLLTGSLEPTNQWYAVAKLAGLLMSRAYRAQYDMDCIVALPTNLYGPGDNFDLQQGHVVPALLRKLHAAKFEGDHTVKIWGTGLPRREFLHVNDLADALIHLVTHYSDEAPVNIGSGQEVSIAELAGLAAEVVGYRGKLSFDTSMPDGAPRKLLDVTRLTALGWRPRIALFEGLQDAYSWYVDRLSSMPETEMV